MSDEVRSYIASISSAKRRRDAETLLALYGRATGCTPQMWGTIIGFGRYHYRYDSGREGDAPAAGFAPRKAAASVYLSDGVGAHAALLERLGPHRAAVGCLYLNDLDTNDLAVLEEIVRTSYATLTSGTFTSRARDGGT